MPILSEVEFNALVGKRFADAESFVLPSWIDEIADTAFLNCWHMKKVVLHEGVTRIGNRSFAGCSRLTDVKLPLPKELSLVTRFRCLVGRRGNLKKLKKVIRWLQRHGARFMTLEEDRKERGLA